MANYFVEKHFDPLESWALYNDLFIMNCLKANTLYKNGFDLGSHSNFSSRSVTSNSIDYLIVKGLLMSYEWKDGRWKEKK